MTPEEKQQLAADVDTAVGEIESLPAEPERIVQSADPAVQSEIDGMQAAFLSSLKKHQATPEAEDDETEEEEPEEENDDDDDFWILTQSAGQFMPEDAGQDIALQRHEVEKLITKKIEQLYVAAHEAGFDLECPPGGLSVEELAAQIDSMMLEALLAPTWSGFNVTLEPMVSDAYKGIAYTCKLMRRHPSEYVEGRGDRPVDALTAALCALPRLRRDRQAREKEIADSYHPKSANN